MKNLNNNKAVNQSLQESSDASSTMRVGICTHININMTDELIKDLLITALEGGSNYWYAILINGENKGRKPFNKETDRVKSEKIFDDILQGQSFTIVDTIKSYNVLGQLNKENIIEGTKLLFSNRPIELANIVSDNWDAGDADIWFQLVVLKEIVYG